MDVQLLLIVAGLAVAYALGVMLILMGLERARRDSVPVGEDE